MSQFEAWSWHDKACSVRCRVALLFFVFGAFLVVPHARAHKMDAARLDIRTETTGFSATLYLPAGWQQEVRLEAPSGCLFEAPVLRCEQALEALVVQGLEGEQQVIALIDGASVLGTMSVDAPSLSLDEPSSFLWNVWLGVIHVLLGWDHVAFLLALLLWVRVLTSRLIAITAFTVGHSITLVAVAFGFQPWSSGVTELLIAISVLLLAVETMDHDAEGPRSWELAGLVGGIGLIHGLGFGGVLLELGTARNDAMSVLFGFNVGIEVGQLALFGVVTALTRLKRLVPSAVVLRIRAATVGAIGVLGAFWTIDRSISWVTTLLS